MHITLLWFSIILYVIYIAILTDKFFFLLSWGMRSFSKRKGGKKRERESKESVYFLVQRYDECISKSMQQTAVKTSLSGFDVTAMAVP